jgi:hypothetical protein
MANSGTATIDFGASPGSNRTTVVVTGEAGILSGSSVEAFIMGETSADHNAYEHEVAPIKLTCGTVVAATGFTIVAVSDWVLTGQFTIRWVWA